MAEFRLPQYVGECPVCGEPFEVLRQRSTPMPGEVVIDFSVRPHDHNEETQEEAA